MKYARPVLPLLLCLAACQGSGLNGPEYEPLQGGEGLCFEINLSDGFQDKAEVSQVFDCFNQYGAFDAVAPLVHYTLASDRTEALLDALNGTMSSFDVPGVITAAARLLRAPERPLDGAQAVYVEAYDQHLLDPLLAVAGVGAQSMDACEASPDPASCSVLRLGRALLATDLLDRVARVIAALPPPTGDAPPDDPYRLGTVADLLLAMRAELQPDGRNVLLSLGSFFLTPEGADAVTPLDRLVGVAQPLLEDDALIEALASEIARIDRDGKLDALDDDIRVLFTHDLSGQEVGFDGDTIVHRVLDVLGAADPALLREPIVLPGSDAPTTLLDAALVLMDDLYEQDADLPAILDAVADVTDLICTSDASNELCELVDTMLPPVQALIGQTTFVPAVVLPLVHVLHEHVDLDPILDVLPSVLAWDLLPRTEPVLRFAVERDLLSGLPDLVRAFIDPRLGRVRADGWDAVEVVRALLRPIEVDGASVVPLQVPLPLARAMLRPTDPDADLDHLTVLIAERVVNPDSALSAAAVADLLSDLALALELEHVDLLAVMEELLDNEPLWRAGVHLLADDGLIALLRPDDATSPLDAPGWLRDLIGRGLLDRMLDWVAALLGQLGDIGLLDLPPAADEPAPDPVP